VYDKGGKRCTSCCKVVHISKPYEVIIWKCSDKFNLQDKEYIRKNWVRVSKRRAKKINPHMFKLSTSSWGHMSFFTCKQLTEEGCGDYENRLLVCSRYG